MLPDEELQRCGECGEEFQELVEGGVLCQSCTPDPVLCGWCQETEVDEDEEICQPCENKTGECGDCGERQWERNLNDVGQVDAVCDSCYQFYGTCERCQDVYHENDLYSCDRSGDFHCDGCRWDCEEDDAIDNNGLHSYGYKPPLTFLGPSDDGLYMGVELEIDKGEIEEVVPALKDMREHDKVFYLKEDGSLGRNGVEIITHPATLVAHLDGTIPWQQILTTAKQHGYTSHDAKTCGLHVHLSRAGLGANVVKREATLSNMILFVWRHWEKVRKLSRRTNGQMMWCQPNHEVVRDFEPSKVENAKRVGRHVVLNNTNSDTIELRLFRGTLRLETLVATLQFSHHLVTFCRGKEAIDIVTGSWQGFTREVPQELKDYLEVRQCR